MRQLMRQGEPLALGRVVGIDRRHEASPTPFDLARHIVWEVALTSHFHSAGTRHLVQVYRSLVRESADHLHGEGRGGAVRHISTTSSGVSPKAWFTRSDSACSSRALTARRAAMGAMLAACSA